MAMEGVVTYVHAGALDVVLVEGALDGRPSCAEWDVIHAVVLEDLRDAGVCHPVTHQISVPSDLIS